VRGQGLGPGLAEGDLADAGGGLALLERQGELVEPQYAAPERDGAGGDDDDVAPF
jgi:hypothetical protein